MPSFQLAGQDVHVWPVRIEAPEHVVAVFQRILTPDERERAARFRFEHLRRSFILSRGALRVLLGRYLQTGPAEIRFRLGSKGKPALLEPSRLQFNASHSGDIALFAFTLDREIGVDVEHMRQLSDMEDIARRFFCTEESAELLSLPPELRKRAFFSCWTRKEAYIKATGDGLSIPLDHFRVTLRPADPARFIHIAQNEGVANDWMLHDFELGSDYTGSLAYRGSARQIDLLPLTDPAELASYLD